MSSRRRRQVRKPAQQEQSYRNACLLKGRRSIRWEGQLYVAHIITRASYNGV